MQVSRAVVVPSRLVLLLLVASALLAFPLAAEAAYPGPNGKIQFTRGSAATDDEIFTMNPDGSDQVNISQTSPVFDDANGQFSADGLRIVFVSDRDGNNEIYAMDVDGQNQVRLTNNAANDAAPDFTPEGRIVFVSDRHAAGDNEIYIMDADGQNVLQLTNTAGNNFAPSVSPDGQRVAFTSNRDGQQEIYAMDIDGTNVVRLTNILGADRTPDFSPDGQKIAFISRRAGNLEVFIMNADGSAPQRLTFTATEDEVSATISPDGTKIAFSRDLAGPTPTDAFTMNIDGSNQVNLTNTPLVHEGGIDWQAQPAPEITVDKNASPSSLPAPGGNFTFNVSVTNTGIPDVTITSLVDDIYGDLNGKGSCATGTLLAAAGGSYACSFTAPFAGAAGDVQTDVVTAVATDSAARDATASDSASVSLTAPLDQVTCHQQVATIVGTPEPETIAGTSGPDVIAALGGRDLVRGRGGDDVLCGGKGLDVIKGGQDDDFMRGGSGRDECDGGPGRDDAYRSCQTVIGVP